MEKKNYPRHFTLDKNLHSGKTTQYSQMQITKHQEGSNSQILNKINSMKY